MGVVDERKAPLVSTGIVLPDGTCDVCGFEGPVGAVYKGFKAEEMIFLCRTCGLRFGVK